MILACLSSLMLMWPMYVAGPLVLDVHGSYWMIDSDLPGGVLNRSLNYAAIPPLSGRLQQLFLAAFGKHEFVLRLPSAVCHLTAILVIYAVGTQLRDHTVGGLAALVLAWHPEALDEVRIARCYGLVLLMSSLVLLAANRSLAGSSGKSRQWLAAWACCSVGLLWTHYTTVLLVFMTSAGLGISCLKARRTGYRWPHWLLSNIAIAVLCLPLIPSVLRLREWGPFLNYMSADQSIWNFIGPIWWLGIPAGWLLCFILNGLLRRTAARGPSGGWIFCLACSLLPVLLLACLSTRNLSSLANPRYRVAYAPAGACVLAMIMRTRTSWPVATLGVVAAISISWFQSSLLPWQLGRLGSAADAEWREAGVYLSENMLPGESVFVQGGLAESNLVPFFSSDPLFLEYVACRVSRFYLEGKHSRIGLPFLWHVPGGVRSEFKEKLLNAADTHGSFWIAAATDTDLNRSSLEGLLQIAAECNFVRRESREWPNLRLQRYAQSSSGDR